MVPTRAKQERIIIRAEANGYMEKLPLTGYLNISLGALL